jgi:hypothetical protein
MLILVSGDSHLPKHTLCYTCLYCSSCNKLTAWSRVLLEKLTDRKHIPNISWNPKIITLFTSACNWTSSLTSSIKFTHWHSIPLRSILMACTIHARVLQVGSFLMKFQSISLHSHECYMPHPYSCSSFDSDNIWREVQIMKILITQFCPDSSSFFPLGYKYSPQHPVLRHPQVHVGLHKTVSCTSSTSK